MRVEYNVGWDGWTQTERAHRFTIEISDRAWKILSKAEHGSTERVIPCQFAFVTTEHLLTICAAIDALEHVRKVG